MPQKGSEVNTIQFNYFRGGELINTKFRDAEKNFKLVKDAELILYGLDNADLAQDVVLVEGEADCLTLWQSGFKNVLSVPNGANLKKNNLAWLDSVAEDLEKCPCIYLAFDNDEAGRKLREDVAERLGKDKCRIVEFKDCKDANDCLKKYGVQGIIESMSEAKEFPLEGVFTIEDIEADIQDMYENGLPPGQKTQMMNLNKLLTFTKGYITTITGVPNHGKSDFLDQLILQLGWACAYYSPENKPTKLHFSKLARKVTGKNWSGENRMTQQEVQLAMAYLNQNLWFVKPPQDFGLDSILNHVKQLHRRRGLDCFVIDAWNKLEHKYEVNETKYIGESLDKLSNFCEQNNLHCFLVAHPKKMMKQKNTQLYEIPNLYDISGSAHFFNKTDNGLCVYRNFEDDTTEVHVQKVKFSHWGSTGLAEFKYDLENGRFNEYNNGLYTLDKAPWMKFN